MRHVGICTVGICCALALCGKSLGDSNVVANANSGTTVAGTKNAAVEVVIIGTIHVQHLKASQYSPEVLRDVILALKPNAILNELPLDQVESNGRPKYREYGTPEGWASDQAASQLNVPQIPFDRSDRTEYYAKTHYFQRQARVNSSFERWLQTAEAQHSNDIDLEFVRFILETQGIQSYFWERPSPEFINSDVFDKLMYMKHVKAPPLLLEIVKKSPKFTPELAEDMKFLQESWKERNAIMAQNIERAARQYPGGRLVVLTGAEHRYILRDLLRTDKQIILKEYWELVDIDITNISPSPDRKTWENLQKSVFVESPAICREYWEAVIEKNWAHAAELYPARSAANIKREFSKSRPVAIVRIEKTRRATPGEGTTGPITSCIIKYEGGRILEIKMITRWTKDKCVIVATLANSREVSKEELDKDANSEPSHE